MIEYAIETRNLTKRIGAGDCKKLSLQIPKRIRLRLAGTERGGEIDHAEDVDRTFAPVRRRSARLWEALVQEVPGPDRRLDRNPALYGNLTAFENLLIHSRLMGLSEEEIDEVLVITGLETQAKNWSPTFPSG